ncbi:hypothetical protein HXX76_013915 [Chlamydomonas incerta]|uniref:Protein kinase domain-containing protein n=1 Tax=Chlamydomonas incerta TaxID=51695 RepID=A0A835SGK4_CHLIN|nr:hypothetical protein HXX76_013915 [Chlamydomonas incerta]|eukprot:KAG2425161.1 hypothetical protein HXX76_013915 [Chlamydomonas incerta]
MILGDLRLEPEDFGEFASALPLVRTRNLTVSGASLNASEWPVLDLNSGSIARKVRLTSGAELSLTRLVIVNYRQGAQFQAPGLELLLPVAAEDWNASCAMHLHDMAMIQRACLPGSIQQAALGGAPRPPGAPPNVLLTSRSPSVAAAAAACSNASGAPAMRRCWADRGRYVAVETYGYDIDGASGKPVRTGYNALGTSVDYLCEISLSDECVGKLGPLGCFLFAVPATVNGTTPPTSYTSAAAAALLAASGAARTTAADAPADGGGGDGGDSNAVILGAVLGGVLGGVALLGAAAAAVVLLRRRLRRRLQEQSCHVADKLGGSGHGHGGAGGSSGGGGSGGRDPEARITVHQAPADGGAPGPMGEDDEERRHFVRASTASAAPSSAAAAGGAGPSPNSSARDVVMPTGPPLPRSAAAASSAGGLASASAVAAAAAAAAALTPTRGLGGGGGGAAAALSSPRRPGPLLLGALTAIFLPQRNKQPPPPPPPGTSGGVAAVGVLDARASSATTAGTGTGGMHTQEAAALTATATTTEETLPVSAATASNLLLRKMSSAASATIPGGPIGAVAPAPAELKIPSGAAAACPSPATSTTTGSGGAGAGPGGGAAAGLHPDLHPGVGVGVGVYEGAMVMLASTEVAVPVTPFTPQNPDLVLGVRVRTARPQRPGRQPPHPQQQQQHPHQQQQQHINHPQQQQLRRGGAAGAAAAVDAAAAELGASGLLSGSMLASGALPAATQSESEVQLLPTVLGQGGFGRVVEGLYGGQRVAVKLIAKAFVPVELYGSQQAHGRLPTGAAYRSSLPLPRLPAGPDDSAAAGGNAGNAFSDYRKRQQPPPPQQQQLHHLSPIEASGASQAAHLSLLGSSLPGPAPAAPGGGGGGVCGDRTSDGGDVSGAPWAAESCSVDLGAAYDDGSFTVQNGKARPKQEQQQQQDQQQQEHEGTPGSTVWQAQAFVQEVEILGRCRHDNIVRLLAANLIPPHVCLVMERMDCSLEALLRPAGRSGPGALLPLPTALHIAADIARGLEFLHPTIVHRDLKPANVLLNNPTAEFPTAKLTDFGLSRLRATTMATQNPEVGTPAYMAPEVFEIFNFTITDKADMYALGVILWELVSGAVPWAGLSLMEIAVAVTFHKSRLPLAGLAQPAPPAAAAAATATYSTSTSNGYAADNDAGGGTALAPPLPAPGADAAAAAAGVAGPNVPWDGVSRCPPRLAALMLQCWEQDPKRRPAAAEAIKELLLIKRSVERHQQQQRLRGRSSQGQGLSGSAPMPMPMAVAAAAGNPGNGCGAGGAGPSPGSPAPALVAAAAAGAVKSPTVSLVVM